MAYSRGRPSGGSSIISMLSDRYKEPDTSRANPAGAGRGPLQVGQTRGVAGGAGKAGTLQQQRSEETTYSFSQEEQITQDGRTVFKTKEEKSYSEKPRQWSGESAAAPAPKVSIKTITLSSNAKGDGQPVQITNSFGGLQRDSFGFGAGQPHRQDYQCQQTITTKTVERGGVSQQPQIHQIQQQSVYQQQKQPTYGQQRQQPSYGQQQQQPSYGQQQQTSYSLQQQSSYGQPKQPSYAQQQQPSDGQQQQPSQAQQKQPSYAQQQQLSFVQQQQSRYAQQQQPSQPQQQPINVEQKQPTQPQQQPIYGEQKQPSQAKQQPIYGQQKQPSQPQQQPIYGQQKQPIQPQQQPIYGQQKQPSQPQQQPIYGQQKQPSYGQQQQPSYGQQKQPSYAQQQQSSQAQQQPSYGQQQPSYGQQQQPSYGQQKQQPSYAQQQQPSYGQQQQPSQPQQQPSYGQQKQPGYAPQVQPSYAQQQQTIYGQQKPAQQQQPQQPNYAQQQQQQQRSSYQQQQQQQQQQRPGQPQPQQQPHQQSVQQNVSTVHSGVYRQGQPSVATITTITTTSTTTAAASNTTAAASNTTPAASEPFPWEEPEEGVHENEPEARPDLVRETDRNWKAELPSAGLARNLKEKFLTGNLENRPASFKKEMTPPSMAGGGVFENQPLYNPDVVHYGEEVQSEALPERGTARYMAHRFKEMEKPVYPSGSTPGRREITPDRTTRGEYVSEPRGYVEKYEGRPESGVFESQPVFLEDVVKADDYEDDRLQEQGLARSIAAHFRQVGSYRPPPASSRPKEFTPPREDGTLLQGYGVYENSPQYDPTVVHAEDQQRDILPDRGMTRTIVTRFRTLSSGDATPKSPRVKKEFTPPRDGGGVYENTPTQFVPDYNRRPESGILENQPEVRYDVVRADAPPPYEVELPERGLARSLVTTWRYKESDSSRATPTGSGKLKEFTPPREEPRVLLQRSSSVGYDGFGISEGSVHPYDLPGQYQPMAEASVFESEPVYLDHVVREADTDWMEGMPRQDSTKKMVAKFRHFQQQAATDPEFSSPAARPPLPAARQAQNLRY